MGTHVEHCLLEPTAIARQNLLQTYVSLAEGLGDTKIQRIHEMTVVTGEPNVSFGFFAAGFDPNYDQDARLRWLAKFAGDHPRFWVFHNAGDSPSDMLDDLVAAGFEKVVALANLVLTDEANTGSQVCPDLQEAIGADRLDVAAFMVDQFFENLNPVSQRKVKMGTASSQNRLFYIKEGREIIASVMVAEQEQSLGLYNLCVSHRRQEQGIGSDITRHVCHLAKTVNLPVVLQCRDDLVNFYGKFGFSEFGRFHALLYQNDRS